LLPTYSNAAPKSEPAKNPNVNYLPSASFSSLDGLTGKEHDLEKSTRVGGSEESELLRDGPAAGTGTGSTVWDVQTEGERNQRSL
jgi:hypothetical protein